MGFHYEDAASQRWRGRPLSTEASDGGGREMKSLSQITPGHGLKVKSLNRLRMARVEATFLGEFRMKLPSVCCIALEIAFTTTVGGTNYHVAVRQLAHWRHTH